MEWRATRGAVCRAFGEPLEVEELRVRSPRADEVLVDVAACSVCHSDLSYVDGDWEVELPAVVGHEAAGTVVDVGSVRADAIGQRVVVTLIRACRRCALCRCGLPALCVDPPRLDDPLRDASGRPVVQGLRTAAFAEHVLVHESQVVPVPRDAPFEAASLLGCGVLTGVGAVLNTASVPSGASVVVVGAGGVGLNCVQGAVLAGADPIVAVDPVASKLEAAGFLGATHVVSAADEDPVRAVRAATDGGADFVFVAAGAEAAFESGMRMLGRGGALVIVGMPPSGVRLALDPTDVADNGYRILGSKMGSADPHALVPWLLERHAEGRLALERLVTGRYRLDEVNEALAGVREGTTIRNVVLTTPG